MIIGVDVDGVLADFNRAFIQLCVKVTDRDLYPAGYQPHTWNYPESMGYTKEETTAVWAHIKANPVFWQTLPSYYETGEALEYLQERRYSGDDVYFITNRMGTNPKRQTELWLNTRGFGYATVLLSEAKGLCARALKLDVYIDDKWENCLDVATDFAAGVKGPSKTRTYLMDRPWNHDIDTAAFNIIRTSTVVGIADTTPVLPV